MARKLKFHALTALLAAVAMLVGVTAASAQFFCAPRQDVLNTLADRFSEERRAYGVIGNSAIMEIYVAKKGTWTIVITDTAGRSCVIAAGEGWEEMEIVFGEGV